MVELKKKGRLKTEYGFLFSDGLVGCQDRQTRAKSFCFLEMDIMLADSFFYYLVLVGFAAGLMDAAVGGGGLLQIPGLFNLLPNATPVASVMGVNKFASCCGTLTATGQYLRRIPVLWKMLLPAAALAFAASYLGSKMVVYFPVQYMKPAMLVIMIAMCLYTFLKKDLGQTARTEKLTRRETLWGLFFGALIGFYDGVFGPGTGSLLAFVFVRFYSYDFLAANASAKVINWTIKNGMLLR